MSMSVLKEFKEFAVKGNAIDMAVGVIIGAAFGKIVTVLVEKIIMPPLGLLIGGMDFSQMALQLKPAGADGKGAVAIGYGELVQSVFNFLIIAFAIFLAIKILNSMKRKQAIVDSAPTVVTPEEVLLLREIRDQLKKS